VTSDLLKNLLIYKVNVRVKDINILTNISLLCAKKLQNEFPFYLPQRTARASTSVVLSVLLLFFH
jgi:hypothetical protein